MPRLWNETIALHRQDVREAIMDATARLVAEDGLRAVTMSRVAQTAGIGRATLYRYFPDVDAILVAWHERQIAHHLAHLAGLRDRAGDARTSLEAVLEAYALIQHDHDGSELAALLHRGEHVARARETLTSFVRDLLSEAAAGGDIRDDVPAEELASYCLSALAGAGSLPSRAAVQRLVTVTLAGLHPPRQA